MGITRAGLQRAAVALACVALLAAMPVAAEQESPLRVQLRWLHQSQFAGYYFAEASLQHGREPMAIELAEGGPGIGMAALGGLLRYTAQKYAATKDASLIREGHNAGRHIGYCHIEKLHNLEALPAHGFLVSCFPHKIRGASAGWTRAVAIIDERLQACIDAATARAESA